MKPQSRCPFTGKAIDKKVFVDIKGYRVYLSDKKYLEKAVKYPKLTLDALRRWGEKAEKLSLCKKCGEIKGKEPCCKPAPLCDKCGRHKGSPGCCIKL